MRVMIIMIWLASTLFQVGHYVESAHEAQQLMTQMYVDDEVLPDVPVVEVVPEDDDEYSKLVGDWFLTMAYLDGEYQYFDEDSDFREYLSFYDDRTVELFEYSGGTEILDAKMDVTYDDIYFSFIYDSDTLPSTVSYEEYMVVSVYDDEMTVALMFYDEDEYYAGSYNLFFEKQ